MGSNKLQQFIMSQLVSTLLWEGQSGSILPDPNYFHLSCLMMGFSKQVSSSEAGCYSFLQKSEPDEYVYNLLWKFTSNNQGKYYLKLIPQSSQNYGAALKLDNQRLNVDLLSLVVTANAETLRWKMVVDPKNQLYLYLSHSVSVSELKTTLGDLRVHAKQILNKFLSLSEIRMHSIQNLPAQELSEPRGIPESQRLQKEVYKAVFMLQIQPKIRNSIRNSKFYSKKEKQFWIHQKQQYFRSLNQKRLECTQSLGWVLQLQGTQTNLSTDLPYDEVVAYDEDMKMRISKKQRRSRQSRKKNVVGMKILKNIEERDFIENQGNHSTIKFCRYQLEILGSINREVNDFLTQDPRGKALQYSKQLELVKKLCKDINKETCSNAFLNEMMFIKHIKEFSCKYAPTFYIDCNKIYQNGDKNRLSGNQSIIMDSYPSTLQAMIRQNSPVRLIDQLNILRQIADGLSWLYSLGICHRDIKPANIMLDCNRVPKIIDFGSCCAAQSLKKSSFEPRDKRLLTTPNYSLRFDDKSGVLKKLSYTKNGYERHPLFDCYSFGRVMEEMMVTHVAGLGELGNMLQFLWKSCQSEVPDDRPTYEEISYILVRLIKWLKSMQEEVKTIWVDSR